METHAGVTGLRDAATVIAEQLLDGEAEILIRKAIQKAKQGNVPALRMCLDRILPPRRERPVRFKLPGLGSAKDASKAMEAITVAVACAELTTTEAGELSRLVESYVKIIEVTEIERRIQALEENNILSFADENSLLERRLAKLEAKETRSAQL